MAVHRNKMLKWGGGQDRKRQKGKCRQKGRRKRLHPRRTPRRHIHHCHSGGTAHACHSNGKRSRKTVAVHQ